MSPHDEFLELCAVSTSGDLTEAEQSKLKAHLAVCPECRQALKEFESAVDVGVPLLSSKLATIPFEKSAPLRESAFAPVSLSGADSEALKGESADSTDEGKRGFAFAGRHGYRPSQVNWNYVWMPFAACVLLGIALGITAYRVGKNHNVEVARTTSVSADARIEALEQQISDVGHERAALRTGLAERDQIIGELRQQTEQQSKSLNDMKSAQAGLERSLQADEVEKQRVQDERGSFAQKFGAAEASLQKAQSERDSVGKQRALEGARDASLESQIKDLSGQLREQEQKSAKQDELLAHDRDIRELMGARDLYVAEIYDVARDGSTQKSYGRVFYTKGVSLICYAYDLDQEPGVRNASTFQAWGRRGPDKKQALNLGVFYEDSAAEKRWVLKFNNPKALDQIDALYVTVEPNGGSHTPSGKPLLYAYLRLPPNHP